MGCGPNCARIILIIYNTILWLSGAALLGYGVFILSTDHVSGSVDFLAHIDDLLPVASDYLVKTAAYVMVGIGSFIFLVGFCGCCGAIKENRCLLGTYMCFLLVVMLCEIAVAGLAIYYHEESGKEASGWTEFMETTRDEYSTWVEEQYASEGNFREVINNLQIQLECCGWSGVQDYENVTWDSVTGIVPSCCTLTREGIESHVRELGYDNEGIRNATACVAHTEGAFYSQNCYEELDEWLNVNAIILVGVGFGIASLEVLGLIFACCLYSNIGDSI